MPAELAIAVIAVTVALVALLVYGRRRPCQDEDGPAWWRDFEREFADYVARRRRRESA
jgi:hypothetical protein